MDSTVDAFSRKHALSHDRFDQFFAPRLAIAGYTNLTYTEPSSIDDLQYCIDGYATAPDGRQISFAYRCQPRDPKHNGTFTIRVRGEDGRKTEYGKILDNMRENKPIPDLFIQIYSFAGTGYVKEGILDFAICHTKPLISMTKDLLEKVEKFGNNENFGVRTARDLDSSTGKAYRNEFLYVTFAYAAKKMGGLDNLMVAEKCGYERYSLLHKNIYERFFMPIERQDMRRVLESVPVQTMVQ